MRISAETLAAVSTSFQIARQVGELACNRRGHPNAHEEGIGRGLFTLGLAASISFGSSFIVGFEELRGPMAAVSERLCVGGGA